MTRRTKSAMANPEAERTERISPRKEFPVCSPCGKNIYVNHKSVQCDKCELRHHLNCTDVSGPEYRLLQSDNCTIKWLCDACNSTVFNPTDMEGKVDNILTQMRQFDVQFKKFDKLFSDVETALTSIDGIKKELKTLDKTQQETIKANGKRDNRISNIEKQLKNVTERILVIEDSEPNNSIENSATTDMLPILDKIKDWQSRQSNVIVYNLSESEETSDKDAFTEIVESNLSVKLAEDDILESFRLGKQGATLRPLLVKLRSITLKDRIMNKARMLKYSDSNVAINHDRTPAERSQFKALKEEKKLKENEDTSGEFIYRIKGPPWDLKLVQSRRRVVSHVPTA